MSSRKAVVLSVAVAVVLSAGLGIIIASEATVDKHTGFQVSDAGIDDESTLESGFVTGTNIDDLTGPQTVNFTDVFEDLENYENPLIDYKFDTFPFGSGSESESKSKRGPDSDSNPGQGPNSDSNPGQGPDSDSNPGQGPNSDSNPGQGPNSEPEQEDSDDTESESESEAESEEDSEDTEPEQEPEPESEQGSEPESDSEPEGNPDDTDSESEPEPESESESEPEEDTEDTESDQELESESESQSEPEPEGNADDTESESDQDPEPEENSDDTESSSGNSGSSSGSSAGSGGSDSAEPTVTTTEMADAVTIHVDDANGESIVQSLDLAGPLETDPAISLSTLEVDPADRERFEMTVARPTSDPGEPPGVPHGEALAYVDLQTDLDVNGTINLKFGLDRSAIPDELGIGDVEVLQYTDGEWRAAGVTHDVGGEDHRVTLSEASPIAVVALDHGSVEVVDADVPADWVRAGYETRARVTVRNTGDRSATDTLSIAMDGETVAERNVSLEPDETATVELTFEPTDGGAVTLDGSEIGTLTVADGNDREGENGSTEEPTTAEDMPGFGPVSIVLALLVVALAARIRYWAISRGFRP